MSITQKCKVSNCQGSGKLNNKLGKRFYIKGYCVTHYTRLSRGQSLTSPSRFTHRKALIEGNIAKIPLGLNAKYGYAIVDKEFAYLDKYKWNKNEQGYAVSNNSKNLKLHKLVYGDTQKDMVIDHIDRNPLNNKLSNLRECTRSSNQSNIAAYNDRRYKGTRKRGEKYIAQCIHENKVYHLGTYKTEKEAALAYDKFVIQTKDEYAFTNFRRDIWI